MKDNNQPQQTAEQKENKVLLVSMCLLVVAVIVLAIIGFVFLDKPDVIVEGQADATSVRISGTGHGDRGPHSGEQG